MNRGLEPAPSYFKGCFRPVERGSWYEAVEFCDRLTQHTGRQYRLPSEAEWEYACRAGTTTPFHFGLTLSPDYSNYRVAETYSSGYRHKTMPVEHFSVANAFGLCDIHGNVLEWCLDHWHDSYDGAPENGSAWIDKDSAGQSLGKDQQSRIFRGGSWYLLPKFCRSAYRDHDDPHYRDDDLGFRVVLEPNFP